MAYNDTPLSTETPSQSQPLMRQNFQAIANSWDKDHVPLSSGSNIGFSNKLTFIVQASAPGSAANQIVEYVKTVTYPNGVGPFSELFLQRDGLAPEVQLTMEPSNPVVSANGQSFLPGGIGIKWGTANINSTGTVSYVGAGLTDFPTNTFAVLLTAQGNSRTYHWVPIDRTSFTINASSAGAANVSWLAIGN